MSPSFKSQRPPAITSTWTVDLLVRKEVCFKSQRSLAVSSMSNPSHFSAENDKFQIPADASRLFDQARCSQHWHLDEVSNPSGCQPSLRHSMPRNAFLRGGSFKSERTPAVSSTRARTNAVVAAEKVSNPIGPQPSPRLMSDSKLLEDVITFQIPAEGRRHFDAGRAWRLRFRSDVSNPIGAQPSLRRLTRHNEKAHRAVSNPIGPQPSFRF